jgi:uncharacterized membrane protein YhaH (DUF805 family)
MMLGAIWNLFTWEGRLDRPDFCAGMLGLLIFVTALMGIVWAGMYFHWNVDPSAFLPLGGLFFVVWLTGVLLELSLVIRRFHDLGKPGYHALLLLVPFLNIYFPVLLFFGSSVGVQPALEGQR